MSKKICYIIYKLTHETLYHLKNLPDPSFEQMLNACANGIANVDASGTIVYANTMLHELFGYSDSELIGQPLDILLPEHVKSIHQSFLTQFIAMETRRPMGAGNVFAGQHRNGHLIDVTISLEKIEQNGELSVIATIMEASRLKASETSNELLALVTELTDSAIFITDENIDIVWVNQSATETTGYSENQLKGEHPLFRINSATNISEIKRLRVALNNREEYNGELQLSKANERLYWVKLQTKPLILDSGRTGFLFIESDISSRKAIENKLRAKNNLQRAILDSAQQIIISTNTEGAIVTFNEFAADLLGWQNFEVIGQSTMDMFINKAEYGRFAEHVEAILAQNIPESFHGLHEATQKLQKVNFTFEFQTRKNKVLTIELSANALFDRSGNLDGYLYMGRDISEIKSLEAQSKRNLETLEVTSKIARLGGWELDLTDNNLFWSDEVYRIHELPLQSTVDIENAINYYAPEARPLINEAINTAIEYGTPWDLQLPFITAKGNDIWVRAMGFAEFKDDKAVRLKGTFQDISVVKEAENRAKEASKAKSQFLANMSHEIRTPINGIIGMNELIQQTALSKQQRSYTNAIQRSGEALLSLINDILDFSKIEAGKLKINPQMMSMHELIEGIRDELQPMVDAKGLQLDIHPLPIASLFSDPLRLRQILLNLCVNAVKFTEKGGITISFSRADEQHISFTITDTGSGIPTEKVSELFQEFTQLDASSTRSVGGTGLGLTISKQLVTLLGGEIGINTEYQGGAEFWFSVDTQLSLTHSPSLLSHPARTILVVGHSDYHALFTTQVDNNLYHIQNVNSAHACMTFLHEHMSELEIEFVFIAQQLSGMSGVELIKAIRAQKTFEDLYVFLFDSDLSASELANLNHVGLNGCLTDISEQKVLPHILEKCQNPTITPDNLPFYTFQDIETTDVRVLLVEDNDINQAVAKSMLEKLDMAVDVANNGMDALALLEKTQDRYHAILMDCQMPVLDGYSTTEHIRSRQEYATHRFTPIIALTAHAMEGDEAKCLIAGMNSYIAKPINSERLQQELEKWI